MSSFTMVGPPVVGYSWNFTTGVKTPLAAREGDKRVVTKTDTIRRRKPKGLLAMIQQATAVSVVASQKTNPPGTWYYTNGLKQVTEYVTAADHHVTLGYENPENLHTVDLTALLENKLRAQAINRGVSLGNALGEYRQSARLFGDLAKAVTNATVAAVKKDPRLIRPRGRWDEVTARNYLQYTYGVSPMMDDMYGALEDLEKGIQAGPLYVPIRARVVKRFEATTSVNSSFLSTQKVQLWRWSKTIRRASGYAKLNDTFLQTFDSTGFNPLSIAWELTTLSFVVDWWLNVGEVLEGLGNACLLDEIRYVPSAVHEYLRRVDAPGKPGYYRWIQKTRSVAKTISVRPELVLKPDVSLRHILNGTALLRVLAPKVKVLGLQKLIDSDRKFR